MKKIAVSHIILSLLYVGTFTYPVLFILCEMNYDIYVALGRPFMIGQADGIMGGVFCSLVSLAVIMAVMAIVFRKRLFGGTVKDKIINTLLCLFNFVVMYISISSSLSLSVSYPELNYVALVIVAITIFFTLKRMLGFKFNTIVNT